MKRRNTVIAGTSICPSILIPSVKQKIFCDIEATCFGAIKSRIGKCHIDVFFIRRAANMVYQTVKETTLRKNK